MPLHRNVPSLQAKCLQGVAQTLRTLCIDNGVHIRNLDQALSYITVILPPQIQSQVCHTLLHASKKLVFPELLNEKYIYTCTKLRSEYVWINDCPGLMKNVGYMDGKHIGTLKLTSCHGQIEDNGDDLGPNNYEHVSPLAPLYSFLSTLVNLKVLKCSQLCNNNMLEIISQHCPHIEEINVEMCTDVDDVGVYHLSGHTPDENSVSIIRSGGCLTSTSVCQKLRNIHLEYTLATTASTAILLHMCTNLEEMVVSPDVNIGEVFATLHGSNPDRHDEVTRTYALKVLHTYMELDEHILALICRTCPHLRDVTLRCNGVARNDRNILANLKRLNLNTLSVMNCSMPALLWYLKHKGTELTHLSIQHLTMAPLSLTFTRSHLQQLVQYCPNLTHFTLKLSNGNVQPDVPYSAFGNSLQYFTKLQHLTLEGISVVPEDLSIFITQCPELEELHILFHSLDVMDDNILYDVLASGGLRNIRTLFLYRPQLTYAGLKRLFAECLHLQVVGPLSSWAISKKDRDSLALEIREKNWDLNIEIPEMMNMFVL